MRLVMVCLLVSTIVSIRVDAYGSTLLGRSHDDSHQALLRGPQFRWRLAGIPWLRRRSSGETDDDYGRQKRLLKLDPEGNRVWHYEYDMDRENWK